MVLIWISGVNLMADEFICTNLSYLTSDDCPHLSWYFFLSGMNFLSHWYIWVQIFTQDGVAMLGL